MTTTQRPRSNRSKPKPSKKEKRKAIRSFDNLKTTEHERWRRANDSVGIIATKDLWPSCVGMAMLFETDDIVDGNFIWNGDVKWLTLFNVPPGQLVGSRTQETRWATVSTASLRYGAVMIGREGLNYDFRQCPFNTRKVGHRILTAGEGDVLNLNHEQHPQIFKVSNKVLESVISFGFRFRRNWGKPDGKLIYGNGAHDRLMKPEEWFPTPYVELPYGLTVDEALDAQRDHKNPYIVPTSIREAFTKEVDAGLPLRSLIDGTYLGEDSPQPGELEGKWAQKNLVVHEVLGNERNFRFVLHKECRPVVHVGEDVTRGSVFAYRLPKLPAEYEGKPWETVNPSRKWFALPRILGKSRFEFEYRSWFKGESRVSSTNGEDFPLVPWHLVSHLGTHPANDDFPLQFWKLPNNWGDLYDHACGALIAPPIRIHGWDTFNAAMPYDVAIQFLDRGDRRLPFKPRLSNEEKRKKRADRKASRRKRKGDKTRRQTQEKKRANRPARVRKAKSQQGDNS